LNTGGVRLERQEIRNALSNSKFNELLYDLARGDLFREIWGLPKYTPEELTNHKQPIYEAQFFKSMEDIEVVLRFFALRHMKHFRYGIQGFLDLYMVRSKSFDQDDISFFRDLFNRTLHCAHEIYGAFVFRTFDSGEWSKKPIKGMYDAIMVPLSELTSSHSALVANGPKIVAATRELFLENGVAAVTGRASTRKDLENRIEMFRQLFGSYTTS
jgi:hypothetical protein